MIKKRSARCADVSINQNWNRNSILNQVILTWSIRWNYKNCTRRSLKIERISSERSISWFRNIFIWNLTSETNTKSILMNGLDLLDFLRSSKNMTWLKLLSLFGFHLSLLMIKKNARRWNSKKIADRSLNWHLQMMSLKKRCLYIYKFIWIKAVEIP